MMKPRSIIIVKHRDALITNSGCEKTKQGLSLQKELKNTASFVCGIFHFQ